MKSWGELVRRRRRRRLVLLALWLLVAAGYVHHQRGPAQLRPESTAGLVPLPDELATALQQARLRPSAYVATALRVQRYAPFPRAPETDASEEPSVFLQQQFEVVEGGQVFTDVRTRSFAANGQRLSRDASCSDGTTSYSQHEDLEPGPPHRTMRSRSATNRSPAPGYRLQLGPTAFGGEPR